MPSCDDAWFHFILFYDPACSTDKTEAYKIPGVSRDATAYFDLKTSHTSLPLTLCRKSQKTQHRFLRVTDALTFFFSCFEFLRFSRVEHA